MANTKPSFKSSLLYSFSPVGIVIYFFAVISSLILVFLRHSEVLNQLPFIGDWQIGLHLYNFAISLLFVVVIGGLWALMGVRKWYQLTLPALAMIVVNVVYEFALPFLNVRDPMDALYGTIGSIFGLLLVLVIARFGTRLLSKK